MDPKADLYPRNSFDVFLYVFSGLLLLRFLIYLFPLHRFTSGSDRLAMRIMRWQIQRRQANLPGHYGFHQHPQYFDIELEERTPRDLEADLPPRPTTPWPRGGPEEWEELPYEQPDPRRVVRSSFVKQMMQASAYSQGVSAHEQDQHQAESSRTAEDRTRTENIQDRSAQNCRIKHAYH